MILRRIDGGDESDYRTVHRCSASSYDARPLVSRTLTRKSESGRARDVVLCGTRQSPHLPSPTPPTGEVEPLRLDFVCRLKASSISQKPKASFKSCCCFLWRSFGCYTGGSFLCLPRETLTPVNEPPLHRAQNGAFCQLPLGSATGKLLDVSKAKGCLWQRWRGFLWKIFAGRDGWVKSGRV